MTIEEEYLKAADELREYFKSHNTSNAMASGGMCILIGQMLGENAPSHESLDFSLISNPVTLEELATDVAHSIRTMKEGQLQ
jgi:hypothetical protein